MNPWAYWSYLQEPWQTSIPPLIPPYANLEILYQLVYRKLYHSLTGSYSTHLLYTNHALRGSYFSHWHYTNLLTGSCSTHSQEAMPLMGPVLLTYKKLYHLRISLRNCSLLETATHKKWKLHSVLLEKHFKSAEWVTEYLVWLIELSKHQLQVRSVAILGGAEQCLPDLVCWG